MIDHGSNPPKVTQKWLIIILHEIALESLGYLQ